ncbi:hypothetical protein [Salininema proteolyticum]|uniref:Uncharacterized protein n=1 Tax=Salininema proteolyticum TaxID=1607685 RepID=A0ABV8U3R7_9ACTN
MGYKWNLPHQEAIMRRALPSIFRPASPAERRASAVLEVSRCCSAALRWAFQFTYESGRSTRS